MKKRTLTALVLAAFVCSWAGLMTGCSGAAAQAAAPAETAALIPHDRAEDLLLLVDFQNVYLPGQPWACPTMEQSLENTFRILRSPDAPEYVLTRYMAPEDPVGCWVTYNEEYADINADAFLCGFPESLKAFVTDGNVIDKDTYSSLDSQALQRRMAGKKRLVLTGVVAECCVLATMMDAIDLGYEVVYLYDCISGCTPEYEQSVRALAEMFSPMHTRVMNSEEYLSELAGGA